MSKPGSTPPKRRTLPSATTWIHRNAEWGVWGRSPHHDAKQIDGPARVRHFAINSGRTPENWKNSLSGSKSLSMVPAGPTCCKYFLKHDPFIVFNKLSIIKRGQLFYFEEQQGE